MAQASLPLPSLMMVRGNAGPRQPALSTALVATRSAPLIGTADAVAQRTRQSSRFPWGRWRSGR